tara:strand:+ start:442 stop:813 length:372 start_codon:yes stop_codon:yes gene_type:complete
MNTIIKSSLGGSLSQLFAIAISYGLDSKINIKSSNLIGNILGFILNFFFQLETFRIKKQKTKKFFYFGIQEALTILVNQILFIYILNNYKNERNNPTMVRIAIATIVFFIVSYPLRKWWVFKK